MLLEMRVKVLRSCDRKVSGLRSGCGEPRSYTSLQNPVDVPAVQAHRISGGLGARAAGFYAASESTTSLARM